MAKYIERSERLVLALNAGARAIENNKRLAGTTYVVDVFSENPKEISYCEAAKLLREFSETIHADVAPIRHGRWVEQPFMSPTYECSECGSVYEWWENDEAHYCPNCGAKMDGGDGV